MRYFSNNLKFESGLISKYTLDSWLFHFLQVIADGFTQPVTNMVTHLDMMNSLPTKVRIYAPDFKLEQSHLNANHVQYN